MSRRPEAGGGGRCGRRELTGCAAATAVRNKDCRKSRAAAVMEFHLVRDAPCSLVLRFRGSNHINASLNLVLKERAPRRIVRVSKGGPGETEPAAILFETAHRTSAVADLPT